MIGRLHGRSVFAMLRDRGVRVRAGWLWCSMVIDPAAGMPHVGFAIGRAYGGAVERNRLRRRLRETLVASEVPLPAGWYLIGVSRTNGCPAWSDVVRTTERLMAAVVTKAVAS